MIIEKITANINDINPEGRRTEAVPVDREELNRPHQKLKSETGEVFAISLDQGEKLEAGSVLYQDQERIVYLELKPEKCLVIKPEGNLQWARAAFNIGNMHHPAYVNGDEILTAYDSVLEAVITKLGVSCQVAERKLEGVRANVSQSEGHHHTHTHAHTHTQE